MTVLNISITPGRAVVSQDRGMYDGGRLSPVESAPAQGDVSAQTFVGSGTPVRRPGDMLEVTKLRVLPERNLIIAGAGSWPRVAMWPKYLPEGDVSEVAEKVPAALRHLVREIGGIDELLIVHVGWSEAEGRVLGYACEMSTGFAPVRLDRGHSLMPTANPAAPDYPRLADLWGCAAAGRQMELFHRELFKNQLWSYRQGLLRPGVHLSSSLDLVSVDAGGAGACQAEAAALTAE